MNHSEQDPPPDAAFQQFLRSGSFRLQQCGACTRHVFFPRTLCPHCGSGKLAWEPVSGRGTVYSVTTVRQKPERGGDYNLSLVDLDEGVRMLSRVVGVPPAQVRIGLRVEAQIVPVEQQHAVVFRPAGSAS